MYFFTTFFLINSAIGKKYENMTEQTDHYKCDHVGKYIYPQVQICMWTFTYEMDRFSEEKLQEKE